MAPSVYWRRRAVAVGVAVLVVVLLVWGIWAASRKPQDSAGPPPPPPPLSAVAADLEPAPCPDSEIRVAAEPARPEFRAGEQVALSIVITNTGDRSCVRDTNRVLRELVITTPSGEHVWGSNDCYSETTNERPVLEPGQSVRNDVLWSGFGSVPGCAVPGPLVAPGEYHAVARLGEVVSPPAPFRILP
ncbi:hypothetical protein [Saccharopolyspora rectivirgula]|uniref:hypothetical protein n=1 Tax=Saccharopolyspora rectivirgula TaxID=28042 RepID=UPI001F3F1DE1|nr:hypothetical protein [Saccharopolyspora rectivirgula]